MRARRTCSLVALVATLIACGTAPASSPQPADGDLPVTLFAPARRSTTTTTTTTTSITATTEHAQPAVSATGDTTTTAQPVPSSPPPESTPDRPRGPAPDIEAAAWAVLDPATDAVLAGRDADVPRPVGSLMKLLTATVVLQAGDLGRVVTAPDELVRFAEESVVGIRPGEQFRRGVLLEAMLVASANDAARALAVDLAVSEAAFAVRMNDAAAAIGLATTSAVNATGLDADGGRSTARDMVVLADVLMDDPRFSARVARTSTDVHGRTFPTTNDLLSTYPGADGVKTGRTSSAAWCIVVSASRDGDRAIVAVLGAPTEADRDAGASALLDWALQ